jgi:hypothetical protein
MANDIPYPFGKRRGAHMQLIITRVFGWLAMTIALAGCATSPGRFTDTPVSINENEFESLVGALQPQRLLQGECGLFLWERSEARDLVFFGRGRQAEGKMQIARQGVTLERVAAEGDVVLGQYPIQTYRRGDLTVYLTLEFEARPNMAGGAAVPRGSLRFEQTGGWNLVMPVAGLVACQPA